MTPIPNHVKLGFKYTSIIDKGVPQTMTIGTGHRQRESVVTSALVRGNRKDPNSHSYTVLRMNFPQGTNSWSWTYAGKYSQMLYEGCIAFNTTDPFLTGVSFPPNLDNRTLSKLNEVVRGSLDLTVGLAQAGQTMRMLNIVKSIREYTHRPINFSWKQAVNDIASARLAWMYGWKPLASDLYGAVDESLRVVINELENFKVRCSERVETGQSGQFSFQNFGNASGPIIRDGKYTCEIGLTLTTAGLNAARWMSLNPLSVAWELVPYSFVVDWIIDVGSYLRDVETSLLYSNRFVNGYITRCTFFDATWSTDVVRQSGTNPKYTYMVKAAASCRYRQLARTKLFTYPAPYLPHFEVDMGASRLLNLAALIGSKLRR